MTKIKNIKDIKDIKDMKEIKDENGNPLTEEELQKISGGYFDIIFYCPKCGTVYNSFQTIECEKCNCMLTSRLVLE